MPEEAEVDLDKLRETIDDEIEHAGGHMLRWISLTTAVLAALAAVASLRAGSTVNEGLVLKTEATQLQAQASDQWAYYQAKGVKLAVAQADADAWRASGKPVPDQVTAAIARYPHEQDSIRAVAQSREKERDAKSEEADQLLEAHHHFAYSVAFFQLAIALGAVAALTKSKPVWWGSLALGLAGLGIYLMQVVK